MRMVGASFARRMERPNSGRFDEVMREAVSLLKGDGLTRAEAEAQREALLEGYRWILVDEYQDVGPEEYALIAAVAGRSLEDPDSRLSLFAVGDDDQNIYSFNGASVAFIRRFEEEYSARASHLIENYRSTANIVRAANLVIAPAAERMKAGHDIRVDRVRRDAPPGGALGKLDPVGQGRVQILPAGDDRFSQAALAVGELRRLAGLTPDWDWARAACHRARVALSEACPELLRGARHSRPDRESGRPEFLATARNPDLAQLATGSEGPDGLRTSAVSDWLDSQTRAHGGDC